MLENPSHLTSSSSCSNTVLPLAYSDTTTAPTSTNNPSLLLAITPLIPFISVLGVFGIALTFLIVKERMTNKLFWEQKDQLTQLIDQIMISNLEKQILRKNKGSEYINPAVRPLGFHQYIQQSEPLDREILKKKFSHSS